MMEAASRVMVLIENAETQGKPTVSQVEQAILGDYGSERRELEEVFSQREVVALANGGNEAIDQAKKIFNLAEHYRLELIRVLEYASKELSDAYNKTETLQQAMRMLETRVAHLESEVADAEAQWPKSG